MDIPSDVALSEDAVADYAGITMQAALASYGEAEIAAKAPVHAAEVVAQGLEYGTDYELGDVVTVDLSDGTRRTGIVAEVVESWDSRGHKATPTIEID